MAICTPADIKTYFDDTSMSDTILTSLIATASSQIENYCGRKFESAAFTEFFSGGRGGTGKIFLTNYPVAASPALVLYDDVDRVFGDSSVILSTSYFVDADTGIIVLDSLLSPGNGNIKVVYTAGYTSGTMPLDLKQAVMEHALRLYKEGVKGDLGQIRKQYADGSVELDRNPFYPGVQRTLDIYRNVVV